MSELVDEASAPTIDAETRVPDIIDTIAKLSSQSLYEDLHHDPAKHHQKSILEREEYERIKANAESGVVEETPELEQFEQTIAPFEELLAPAVSKKNWLSEKIDAIRKQWGERPHRRFVALRTANDVQEFFQHNSIATKSPQPFNPNFTIERNTRIAKLVAYSAPPHLLKQAGLNNLNSEKLAENGVVLQDLRNYRRYPEDLPVFFHSINNLRDAGFTRFHFDSRLWTLHDIAKAYGLDPVAVSGYFGMTVRDLLAADVKPLELAGFGVRMPQIMADNKPFELLFAIRMSPTQLQSNFGFQPSHLFNENNEAKLATTQIDILHTFANWTDADLRKVGFIDAQLKQLCIAPQLSLESIKRAVLGDRMRQRK